MTKRRPRHLSKEEHALWDKVAGSTTPLIKSPTKLAFESGLDMQAEKQVEPAKTPQRFDKTLTITPATKISPDPLPNEKPAPLNMDKRLYQRMKRGKSKPEARIDLHGMTTAQAHPALIGFILRAVSDQKRLVLVITGKGRRSEDIGPIPTRQGVLRHQVPQWLSVPPLAQLVLQVTEAHQSHGGGGAYYVYLRKTR